MTVHARPRQLLVMLALALAALSASISDAASTARTTPADANLCEQHMARAAHDQNVPLGVLYAVGLTETGVKGSLHPYALNIEGKTVIAKNRDEALRVFAKAHAAGKKLIDLGCMQVNYYYHGDKFASPAEMFDPAKNVAYAAKFLTQLREREGSWTMAVARYHASAGNKVAQRRYICTVIRNLIASGFGGWTPESRKFCNAGN